MKQSIFTSLFIFLFGGLLTIDSSSFAQDLNQSEKGAFYLYWGYNRSAYTQSDLHLKGRGYDFTMKNMTASDNPEKLSMSYLNIEEITIPQFNVRLGYFFKDKWALTLGYDHMKYLMDHPQEITLDGEIQPGVSDLWSGTYDNQLVTSDYEHIHYENSDGLNYIRVELARYFDLLSVGQNNWFRVRA